jgi:ABC-type transport system involved in cytochrome c biogenesis permease component
VGADHIYRSFTNILRMNDNPGEVLVIGFFCAVVIAVVAALIIGADPRDVSSTAAALAPGVVIVAVILAEIYHLFW